MSEKIKSIRIHPGIGLARLGNSDEFYIGPEAPGIVVDPGGSGGPGPNGGTYRDSSARLKRQAQRFPLLKRHEYTADTRKTFGQGLMPFFLRQMLPAAGIKHRKVRPLCRFRPRLLKCPGNRAIGRRPAS